MRLNRRTWKKLLAVLCLVLVFSYTSAVFLPHSHECIDTDCAICALLDTSRFVLIGIVLCTAAGALPALGLGMRNPYTYISQERDATPVGLKVKISY